MSINLQRFADTPDASREHLRQPFLLGDWVVASNGHICVRMPCAGIEAAPLPPDNKLHDTIPKLFDKWLTAGVYQPFPTLDDLTDCSHCNGKGVLRARKCTACVDGNFVHDGHVYDCRSCEGEPVEAGWIVSDEGTNLKACAFCGGRGAASATCFIGAHTFELAYVHWLAKLPGATWLAHPRPSDPEDYRAWPPLAVRFDGGEGLLMPRWR